MYIYKSPQAHPHGLIDKVQLSKAIKIELIKYVAVW